MASILQCCPFLTQDPTTFLHKLRPLLLSSAQRCPVMVARTLSRSVPVLQRGKETCGDTGPQAGIAPASLPTTQCPFIKSKLQSGQGSFVQKAKPEVQEDVPPFKSGVLSSFFREVESSLKRKLCDPHVTHLILNNMPSEMVFFLENVLACTKRLLEVISGWLPRHFVGAILISLPALAVFSHFTSEFETNIYYTMFLCSALLIAIVQYCNFCQLSSWMRSSLATLVGGVLLILLYVSLCPDSSMGKSHLISTENFSSVELSYFDSAQNFSSTEIPHLPSEQNNSSRDNPCNRSTSDDFRRPADLIGQEVILGFFLLLLLVWFLNREFEVSYRLHYHGDVEADLHRTKIQSMRDQADWLLRNIIPYHVAEQLKVSQSYSKNHDSGGVIFASIVNFSEFYEENYEGGKECYRVLNELIGDFDELLSKSDYSSIEKIKTIGATYMAASGLNASQCQDSHNPHSHLQTLFEFAKEMMRVVDDFNNNMLWFNFKLRIGFNHGPLTAGVIGTTKLLYDIWGDTVNIASRMDTTGVECRIQVSEESYRILHKMGYDFDYRGTVNVKGKGQMKTYLYPKCMDNGIVPHHQLSISPDIRVQVDGSIGRSPTDEITNLVPSVQNSDKTPQASDRHSELKDGLPGFRKLPKELVKAEDRCRLGKAGEKRDCEEVGLEEASELTKLNSSRSV